MIDKEWVNETNKRLKEMGSVYRVKNILIYHFLVLYFVFTFITLIVLAIIAFNYLQPYLPLLVEKSDVIINFINNTK